MSGMVDDTTDRTGGEVTDLSARIGARVRQLRTDHGYSLDVLAARSGVSRSAISTIERGTASPTAVVLERLATGLDVPLASLFDPVPSVDAPSPVVRQADQEWWRDPGSGYRRRNVSPPAWPSPIRIVESVLTAYATVAYETAERDVEIHQQVWVLAGWLDLTVGSETHHLGAGDCVAMRLDRPITFHNASATRTRYAVVIVSERPPARRGST